ncbi:hypothetical protein FACS1894120_0340 [Clostridia bacterium]|nr:hypothetical protein FACS1894120_0340 [Clostridia bacterium]
MIRLTAFFTAVVIAVTSFSVTAFAVDGVTAVRTKLIHEVQSVGHYTNWAGISNVAQFEYMGEYGFAYVKSDKQIAIVKSKGGEISGRILIPRTYPVFGTVTADSGGNYYIVWGKTGTSPAEKTVFISKYDANGKLIKTAGFTGAVQGASGSETKIPFYAGNCVSLIADGKLIVQYTKERYDGHQQSDVIAVNISDMSPLAENAFDPWTGHSFDQRVLLYRNNTVLFAEQGDCFPRGFHVTAYDTLGKEVSSGDGVYFNFWVQPDTYKKYDMSLLNQTRANIGGFAETDKGVALIGTSVKSLSENAVNENKQLFVQIFDPLKDRNDSTAYVTKGTRSGLAGKNGDERVTDYGVKWLTNYDKSVITDVQAVRVQEKILILYRLYANKSTKLYRVILDQNGSAEGKAESLGDIQLNTDEPPVVIGGTVYWTANGKDSKQSTDKYMTVYAIDMGVS